MGRRIVITSGKGGVGKTTACANLGYALAELGAGVVLLDADIGLNNLDVVLGLESRVVFDLGDVLHEKCRLKQALVKAADMDGLYLLPSSKIGLDDVTAPAFAGVVRALSELFDFVLVDSPAGIDAGFHRAASACREAVVVTTPHISAVRDADKVLSLLSVYDMEHVSLAVNRIRGDLTEKGVMMNAYDVSDLLRVPLAAAIPEDDTVTLQSITAEKGDALRAYRMFADNILGNTDEVFDCERRYRGFFKRFRKK